MATTSTDTNKVTSVASLKRIMQAGFRFRCEHHQRPQISGWREIIKPQSNGFWYLCEGFEDKHCHSHYPSAAQIQFNDDGSVSFLDNDYGKPVFTYHFDLVTTDAR